MISLFYSPRDEIVRSVFRSTLPCFLFVKFDSSVAVFAARVRNPGSSTSSLAISGEFILFNFASGNYFTRLFILVCFACPGKGGIGK